MLLLLSDGTVVWSGATAVVDVLQAAAPPVTQAPAIAVSSEETRHVFELRCTAVTVSIQTHIVLAICDLQGHDRHCTDLRDDCTGMDLNSSPTMDLT